MSGARARPRAALARHCGKRRRRFGDVPLAIPVALMAIGLLIACVPLFMDLAYRATTSAQISQVEDAWSAADDEESGRVWKQARAYNRVLAGMRAKGVAKVLPYDRQLVYSTWPYICYLQIGSVGIELPVYHGTTEEALSAGAGHISGTSLPVGGKGSNCCISAHSGIAASSMFDSLRDVQAGDYVALRTLGRELGYRVAKVRIVDADDNSPLGISKGKDLLTLVTCTSDPMPGMPRGGYGVNDRRLVVTCKRCPVPEHPAADSGRLPTVSPLSTRWWPLALGAGIALAVPAAGGIAGSVRRGRHSRRKGRGGATSLRLNRRKRNDNRQEARSEVGRCRRQGPRRSGHGSRDGAAGGARPRDGRRAARRGGGLQLVHGGHGVHGRLRRRKAGGLHLRR